MALSSFSSCWFTNWPQPPFTLPCNWICQLSASASCFSLPFLSLLFSRELSCPCCLDSLAAVKVARRGSVYVSTSERPPVSHSHSANRLGDRRALEKFDQWPFTFAQVSLWLAVTVCRRAGTRGAGRRKGVREIKPYLCEKVQVPPLPPTRCWLWTNTPFPIWGWNEIMHVKCLAQHLACTKMMKGYGLTDGILQSQFFLLFQDPLHP